MNRLNWPTAFVLVFGALPAFAFTVAVVCMFPGQALPFAGGIALFVLGERISRRRAAVAERAALAYPNNAAIVAARLPDLPTIPLRRSA